ncbi:hypothetical protein GCM10027271_38710 [Saccharopolyspora gloriosae]|uniref:Peptidase inhibitor family I36 n=1 Tax=Saccharopolyspora gloriosae TaxID=455344 RepID=A0A840NIX2_9PSEU|nr:hypothetical protein [Saccharopolyspora gloriosae]
MVLVASVMASFVLVTPSGAAQEGYDRCPHGSFCLFSGVDGTGAIGIFEQGSPDLRQQGVDNSVYSFWNRSARQFEGFDGYDYEGQLTLRQGAYGVPKNSGPTAVPTSSARVS